jgi:hypothetical protein
VRVCFTTTAGSPGTPTLNCFLRHYVPLLPLPVAAFLSHGAGSSEATKQAQRALLAAATPADIEAARRVHVQRTEARHNDSDRRLRATAASGELPA